MQNAHAFTIYHSRELLPGTSHAVFMRVGRRFSLGRFETAGNRLIKHIRTMRFAVGATTISRCP
jgi:hypothetical protein